MSDSDVAFLARFLLTESSHRTAADYARLREIADRPPGEFPLTDPRNDPPESKETS